MTIEQSFFSLVGVLITLFGLTFGYFKLYIDGVEKRLDARIDYLTKQVDLLVNYMISHEGRISILEERTKPK